MITYCAGNLLDSPAKVLVNTVNCVGVMGRGIALEFRKRYPLMYRDYLRLCENGEVRLGEPYVFSSSERTIVNFPTKGHWRAGSRLADIERGLHVFARSYKNWGITSVAFPPLGCGNGGLDWNDVRPLMERYLGMLEAEVYIYAPLGSLEYPTVADRQVDIADPQQTFGFAFESHRHA